MKWFKRSEFRCQGKACGPDGKNCGFDTVDYELVEVVDDLREHFGQPATINSGSRCVVHNKSVGGAKNSAHTTGQACDIKIKDVHADKVADYLEAKYIGKYGIGRYLGRTHIDVKSGPARRWDSR